jgi:predicted nucleotidyltransferase component of viral defense system
MTEKIIEHQKQVLKALSGKLEGYYLAGGTALSLFYFQHRLSVDLDFFTRRFDYQNVQLVIKHLEESLNRKIELVGSSLDDRTARMAVYNIYFTAHDALKIDLVEDTVEPIKDTMVVDGIPVLSLEDIYIRKLYALAGMVKADDRTGRGKFLGGRAEAKDLYDIYCLSHTFMPLSEFVKRYCDRTVTEAVIRWYRTFDRTSMMDGVLDLITTSDVDYKAQERHFEKEVDKLVEFEIEGL